MSDTSTETGPFVVESQIETRAGGLDSQIMSVRETRADAEADARALEVEHFVDSRRRWFRVRPETEAEGEERGQRACNEHHGWVVAKGALATLDAEGFGFGAGDEGQDAFADDLAAWVTARLNRLCGYADE